MYFSSQSWLNIQAANLSSQVTTADTNTVDYGDCLALNRIESFHVLDASSLFEKLTLRRRLVFAYDASLSNVSTREESAVNCRTEFFINLFRVREISHRQDFVSLFQPNKFPSERKPWEH